MTHAALTRRSALALGALLISGVRPGSRAEAADVYPKAPVRLIVPYAAGGLNDATARMWSEAVGRRIGGTIYVDNRGGGGGTVGTLEAVRAPADGYTLMLGSSTTQVLNPAIAAKPLYDPLADFSAISIFAVATAVIAVSAETPVKTLRELIDYIKKNPGKLAYGSAGAGTNSNLTGELFKLLAGHLDLVHVPYKGAGPALSDLIGGQIPIATPHMTAQVLEFHRQGKIRVLAVAAEKRLAGAPEIPTGAEEGLPGLVGTTFNGIFGPRGVPAEIIAKIDSGTQAALEDPAFKNTLIQSGYEPLPGIGGSKATEYVHAELERTKPILKATQFSIQ